MGRNISMKRTESSAGAERVTKSDLLRGSCNFRLDAMSYVASRKHDRGLCCAEVRSCVQVQGSRPRGSRPWPHALVAGIRGVKHCLFDLSRASRRDGATVRENNGWQEEKGRGFSKKRWRPSAGSGRLRAPIPHFRAVIGVCAPGGAEQGRLGLAWLGLAPGPLAATRGEARREATPPRRLSCESNFLIRLSVMLASPGRGCHRLCATNSDFLLEAT